jgi:hypothetical protein
LISCRGDREADEGVSTTPAAEEDDEDEDDEGYGCGNSEN